MSNQYYVRYRRPRCLLSGRWTTVRSGGRFN